MYDTLGEALDMLEFVRQALTNTDSMGNERASNGIVLVMAEALDALDALRHQMRFEA